MKTERFQPETGWTRKHLDIDWLYPKPPWTMSPLYEHTDLIFGSNFQVCQTRYS